MVTTTALALALALPAAATPAPEPPGQARPAADNTVRIDKKKHSKSRESTSARRHSLTLAPFRTSWPAAHVRYELRLRPKLGIDLGAGFGRWRPMAVRVAGNIADIDVPDIDLVEVEAAVNTYPAGRFHRGMQLGLTVRQQWVSTSVATTSGGALAMADASASVFTVGPHIGAKRVWPSGFTLQARVGAGYAVANADVDAVAMFGPLLGTEQVGGSYGGPIVFGNAGIGWSF